MGKHFWKRKSAIHEPIFIYDEILLNWKNEFHTFYSFSLLFFIFCLRKILFHLLKTFLKKRRWLHAIMFHGNHGNERKSHFISRDLFYPSNDCRERGDAGVWYYIVSLHKMILFGLKNNKIVIAKGSGFSSSWTGNMNTIS